MIYRTILEICSRCLAEPRLYNEATLEHTLDDLTESEMNSLGSDVITLKYIIARKQALIHFNAQEDLLHISVRTDIRFLLTLFFSALLAIAVALFLPITIFTKTLGLLCKFAFGLSALCYGISAFLTAILLEKREVRRQSKLRQIEEICLKMKRSRERVMSGKVHVRHEKILNTLVDQINKEKITEKDVLSSPLRPQKE